jgi:hypothetical protein
LPEGHEQLTERGWLLFFQLHEPLADDTALCIDGSREPSDKFDIGVADGYGFLVEVRDGQVNLHPALYNGSGPMPSIDHQAHCSGSPEPGGPSIRRLLPVRSLVAVSVGTPDFVPRVATTLHVLDFPLFLQFVEVAAEISQRNARIQCQGL